MDKQYLSIEGIPAVVWGAPSGDVFIAVHGDQSNKADSVIQVLAEEAVNKGYQVLSFDLPEHGEREGEARQCKVQNCVEDLDRIMRYARTRWSTISLFGCSVGANFGMLAYKHEPIVQALFVSPVVDMKRVIDNMMVWFDVSVERLECEQEVATPAKTLYWDYYQYVLGHPVEWDRPTALLYGADDNLCEFDYVSRFAERTNASVTVLEEGEHFFHTQQQLAFLREWLRDNISS